MNEIADFSWVRVIVAFLVVLALMAGLAAALRYVSARGLTFRPKGSPERRMKVVESLALDARRRCVIVRCDEREHLLLLGNQDDIVIETNLPPSKSKN
jgi:flagellar biogenesis protein FliO